MIGVVDSSFVCRKGHEINCTKSLAVGSRQYIFNKATNTCHSFLFEITVTQRFNMKLSFRFQVLKVDQL